MEIFVIRITLSRKGHFPWCRSGSGTAHHFAVPAMLVGGWTRKAGSKGGSQSLRSIPASVTQRGP